MLTMTCLLQMGRVGTVGPNDILGMRAHAIRVRVAFKLWWGPSPSRKKLGTSG